MSKAQENAAFPGYTMDMDTKRVSFQEGMTLRDYFAAHATEEDICIAMDLVKKVDVVRDLGNGIKVVERGYPKNTRQIARYIHADAMLEARK